MGEHGQEFVLAAIRFLQSFFDAFAFGGVYRDPSKRSGLPKAL